MYLLGRFWNRAATCRSDALNCRRPFDARRDQRADRDQSGSANSLSAMYGYVFSSSKLVREGGHQVSESCHRRWDGSVDDRERDELDAVGPAPRLDLIRKPVAASRTGHDCQATGPRPRNPKEICSHGTSLWSRDPYNGSFGMISRGREFHIDAAIAKDFDAVVTVDDRAVGSHFERSLLTRLPRTNSQKSALHRTTRPTSVNEHRSLGLGSIDTTANWQAALRIPSAIPQNRRVFACFVALSRQIRRAGCVCQHPARRILIAPCSTRT